MLPDFSKPAFSSVALCTVRFRDRADGGVRKIQSDYRCQLQHVGGVTTTETSEVRVYLVGVEHAASGDDLPVLVAFLDFERQRGRCTPGARFELREGTAVAGEGVVHSVARRS